MTVLKQVRITDTNGDSITSAHGRINTHDKDVHTDPVNVFVGLDTATATTLNGAVAVGDTQLLLTSAIGFSVGDHIKLSDGVGEFREQEIVSISTNTITIDSPLDAVHLTGANVVKVAINMIDAAGTVATPKIYTAGAPTGVKWHIKRMIVEMVDNAAGDDTRFGGIVGGITNGVVIRLKTGTEYRTLTNWKTNGNMKEDMYDVDYDDRASASRDYSVSARWTFDKMDIAVNLDAATSDEFQVLCQDDLSGLLSFRIKLQGHIDY